ncbi:hypothetical protein ACVBEH_07350 [Roseateles sp. GG27B]
MFNSSGSVHPVSSAPSDDGGDGLSLATLAVLLSTALHGNGIEL